MTDRSILSHIDHTLLKPTATWTDIEALCREGQRLAVASVCIPPAFVARVKAAFPTLTICTVIGFPLGYATAEAKRAEAADALANGADEIDMVVNLGDVKDAAFDRVSEEIRSLKKEAGDRVLKVIVETCYLTESEKVALCRCVTEGGADFIKTSTGFGSAGAVLSDIALFRQHIGAPVRIKAAGGIRTREQMEDFLAAGCDRIGTSAAGAVFSEALV